MKRKTVGLVLVTLAVLGCLFVGFVFFASHLSPAGFVAALRARFTNGHAELQRSFQAKKDAKSFRMKTVLRMHPGRAMETLTEVSCPNRERITTTIGDRSLHAVRIGDQAFVEQFDGSWETQTTQATAWSPCGEAPGEPAPWATMNEGRDLTTILARISEKAVISRGEFVNTESGPCQEWVMTIEHPAGPQVHSGPGMKYTVCIDPQKHWPLRIVMGGGGMVVSYYDWNQPMVINSPKS